MSPTRRFRIQLSRSALVAWCGGMLLLGAGLLATHTLALPTPVVDGALSARVAGLRQADQRNRWLAVHVLYAECRCSQRIVEHLLQSVRPRDYAEVVLWVGRALPPSELAARFDVRRLTEDELGALGVESAPSLLVLSADDRLRYVGGYTARKQGPVIDDLRLLREARAETLLSALPVFGCAVSERLRQALAQLPSP